MAGEAGGGHYYPDSPEESDVKKIILLPTDDAPKTMIFRRIEVFIDPVAPHIAAAFGQGIIEDLDFGRYMRVDAVE